MPERRSGLHRILGSPRIYQSFQRAVSRPSMRGTFSRRHVRARPHDRVLDIGCGPGRFVNALDDVTYVGVDPSPSYIAAAQEAYGDRGRFICAAVETLEPGSLGTFDVVVAKGVLHHLDDVQAQALITFARSALIEHGRFTTIDPCFSPGQPWFARELARRDRGTHVRSLDGYRSLALEAFPSVTAFEYRNLLRVPYHHAVLECRDEAADSLPT